MISLQKTLKLFVLKHEMTIVEKEALLSELISTYVTGEPSPLMKSLLDDDFDRFQKLVIHMNKEGSNIFEAAKKIEFTANSEF